MSLKGTLSYNGQDFTEAYITVGGYSWQPGGLAQVQFFFYSSVESYTLGMAPTKVFDGTIAYDGKSAPVAFFEASDYVTRTFPGMVVSDDAVIDTVAVAKRIDPSTTLSSMISAEEPAADPSQPESEATEKSAGA